MSENRGQDPAASADKPPPRGDVVLSNQDAAPQSPAPQAANGAASPGVGGQASIRDQVMQRWIAAGATPQGAQGIAQRIQEESGFDPTAIGDNGTSFGMYQHHGDRAMRLLDFAKSQNKSPSDWMVQTDHAISEAMLGGDPIATKHAAAFMKASDPGAAHDAFTQYFERPASLRDMMFTPSGMGSARERMESFDRDVSQQNERDRDEYERIRKESDPNTKERSELMADARARAQQARETYAELSGHPPPDKPIDALQNFGSIGTMLALLIGGMGRHHMNGALAAAGAMMQAAQANNHEQFERQYKIWDHQSNTALNLSRLEGDEVRLLLEDKRMDQNEREARLHSFFEEHQMSWQASQLRAGMLEHVLSAEEASKRARESATNQKFQFSMMMADAEQRAHPEKDPAEVYAKWGIASPAGVKAESDPKLQAANAFKDKIKAEKGHEPTYEDWVQFSQSSKGSTTGQLSPDAVKLLAHQYEMGDPGVITSMPRSGPARIQVENQVAADLGGMDDGAATIVMNRLRMAEARSAATTAGRVTMQSRTFAEEAVGAGNQVVETSKLFPRTNLLKVNEALAAFERQTGDPNIIKFGTAINALLNAYGKLSNPTGTGIHDADKDRLQKILDTSLSHGQIEAGVQQIIKEGRVISEAVEKAQHEVLGAVMPQAPGATPAPHDTATTAPPSSPTAAPEWSKGSATGSNGEKIYTDGTGWFHADHTPVQ